MEVQDAGIVSRRPRSNMNKDKGVGIGERTGEEMEATSKYVQKCFETFIGDQHGMNPSCVTTEKNRMERWIVQT